MHDSASPTDAGVTAAASALAAAPAAARTEPKSTGAGSPFTARAASGLRALPAILLSGVKLGLISVLSALLAAGLMVGLIGFGLLAVPTYGVAAFAIDSPPRRPPIVPPSVPLGAREDWALWSYVDKINQAWGKDWPLVIKWFEELDARYPGNPMVLDKLYVSYLEDGHRMRDRGDLAGARMRYDQAAQYDPARGVAEQLLDELDEQEAAGR